MLKHLDWQLGAWWEISFNALCPLGSAIESRSSHLASWLGLESEGVSAISVYVAACVIGLMVAAGRSEQFSLKP